MSVASLLSAPPQPITARANADVADVAPVPYGLCTDDAAIDPLARVALCTATNSAELCASAHALGREQGQAIVEKAFGIRCSQP
jgi:hypothetical protein